VIFAWLQLALKPTTWPVDHTLVIELHGQGTNTPAAKWVRAPSRSASIGSFQGAVGDLSE